MYYDIYIDVYFLINFMMDNLLLLLVKKVMKCSVGRFRIALTSAIVSVLSCAFVVFLYPGQMKAVKIIVFCTVSAIFMVRFGLGIHGFAANVRGILLLYFCGVLMGGVMSLLRQWLKVAALFYGMAVVSYFLIGKYWELFMNMRKEQKEIRRVVLYGKTHTCELLALWDTGNQLNDPITGEGVHIVEMNRDNRDFFKEDTLKIRYIPYRTVAQQNGVMPIIKIEKMCVFMDENEEKWIQSPWIGVCTHHLSDKGSYTMILNSNL